MSYRCRREIWNKIEASRELVPRAIRFVRYLVYISAWPSPLRRRSARLAERAADGGSGLPKWVADARRHGAKVRGVDINASKAKATIEDGALRLGIEYLRTIGEDLAKKIDEGRPYSSVEDVVLRCDLTEPQAEALATSGAFGCFEPSRSKTCGGRRRRAHRQGSLRVGARVSRRLSEMDAGRRSAADLWSTS